MVIARVMGGQLSFGRLGSSLKSGLRVERSAEMNSSELFGEACWWNEFVAANVFCCILLYLRASLKASVARSSLASWCLGHRLGNDWRFALSIIIDATIVHYRL
jgi:hypothetical protein